MRTYTCLPICCVTHCTSTPRHINAFARTRMRLRAVRHSWWWRRDQPEPARRGVQPEDLRGQHRGWTRRHAGACGCSNLVFLSSVFLHDLLLSAERMVSCTFARRKVLASSGEEHAHQRAFLHVVGPRSIWPSCNRLWAISASLCYVSN